MTLPIRRACNWGPTVYMRCDLASGRKARDDDVAQMFTRNRSHEVKHNGLRSSQDVKRRSGPVVAISIVLKQKESPIRFHAKSQITKHDILFIVDCFGPGTLLPGPLGVFAPQVGMVLQLSKQRLNVDTGQDLAEVFHVHTLTQSVFNCQLVPVPMIRNWCSLVRSGHAELTETVPTKTLSTYTDNVVVPTRHP